MTIHDWLFIDEFIHSLMYNNVTVDKDQQLGGVLALPRLGKKRVLMSGMTTPKLGDMLTKILGGEVPAMLYEHESQSVLAG